MPFWSPQRQQLLNPINILGTTPKLWAVDLSLVLFSVKLRKISFIFVLISAVSTDGILQQADGTVCPNGSALIIGTYWALMHLLRIQTMHPVSMSQLECIPTHGIQIMAPFCHQPIKETLGQSTLCLSRLVVTIPVVELVSDLPSIPIWEALYSLELAVVMVFGRVPTMVQLGQTLPLCLTLVHM